MLILYSSSIVLLNYFDIVAAEFNLFRVILHWKKEFIESKKLAVTGGQLHMLLIKHYM